MTDRDALLVYRLNQAAETYAEAEKMRCKVIHDKFAFFF